MKYLTESQLCDVLQVERIFIYNCRKRGMPYLRIGSRSIRYDLNLVMSWFEQCNSLVNDNTTIHK